MRCCRGAPNDAVGNGVGCEELRRAAVAEHRHDPFQRHGVEMYSSAVYVARDGKLLGRYDKVHLVPFGEYVPLAEYFPWLQRLTPLPVSATPGRKPAAFDLPYGDGTRPQPRVCRIAPNICYKRYYRTWFAAR